jgi:hypothetical protein
MIALPVVCTFETIVPVATEPTDILCPGALVLSEDGIIPVVNPQAITLVDNCTVLNSDVIGEYESKLAYTNITTRAQ